MNIHVQLFFRQINKILWTFNMEDISQILIFVVHYLLRKLNEEEIFCYTVLNTTARHSSIFTQN